MCRVMKERQSCDEWTDGGGEGGKLWPTSRTHWPSYCCDMEGCAGGFRSTTALSQIIAILFMLWFIHAQSALKIIR